MARWLDRFTGQRYSLSDEQVNTVRDAVAQAIAAKLRRGSTPHQQANAVAQWWQTDYYERVFPLRFGKERVEKLVAELTAKNMLEPCLKMKDERLSVLCHKFVYRESVSVRL